MSKAQPMSTAPRDGTRILVKTNAWLFDNNPRVYDYVKSGTIWREAWFKDGKFIEWCGNEKTTSTGGLDPVAWAPVPEE